MFNIVQILEKWNNYTEAAFLLPHFTAHNQEKKCEIYKRTLVRQNCQTAKDFMILDYYDYVVVVSIVVH